MNSAVSWQISSHFIKLAMLGWCLQNIKVFETHKIYFIVQGLFSFFFHPPTWSLGRAVTEMRGNIWDWRYLSSAPHFYTAGTGLSWLQLSGSSKQAQVCYRSLAWLCHTAEPFSNQKWFMIMENCQEGILCTYIKLHKRWFITASWCEKPRTCSPESRVGKSCRKLLIFMSLEFHH